MTRTDLIERLNALSDDEVARIAPYLEANLDAAVAYLEQERGYWLIFEIDERAGEVVILALRHSRRRPGGWRRR